MKWQPAALMVLLLALGVWIVLSRPSAPGARPGADLTQITIGPVKGYLETTTDSSGTPSYRIVWRDGTIVPATGAFTSQQLAVVLGAGPLERMTSQHTNWVFRALNITEWKNLAWVLIGLGGQLMFASRWIVQWIASEKSRSSVMPASFWWMSLVSGVILFAYFAWRQDVVGVLGQASGVVVYARNIRLRTKEQRRLRREGEPPGAVLEPKPTARAHSAS